MMMQPLTLYLRREEEMEWEEKSLLWIPEPFHP